MQTRAQLRLSRATGQQGRRDLQRSLCQTFICGEDPLYERARQGKMFDDCDLDFKTVSSESRIGIPILTEKGMIFLSECRFGFDQYNLEFTNTTVGPRLIPPIMLADGSICCMKV
jgi:hypothetical protein